MPNSVFGMSAAACVLAGTLLAIGAEESPLVYRGNDAADAKVTTKNLDPSGAQAETAISDGLMREGAKLVEQIGEFQKSGDQVNFYLPNRKTELRVLPNLALERVVRILEDNPSVRTWNVSGVITEYQGENYLLLTRAVLKARPTQPLTRKRRLPAEAEKGE